MTTKITFDTLALSGGGLKGFAYIGFLRYLEETSLDKDVRCVIGTSIGAFFGLLYIIGYVADEMENFMLEYHYDIEGDFNINDFLGKFGVSNGNSLRDLISELLINKGFNKDVNLNKLTQETGYNFITCVCCIETGDVEYFESTKFPNLNVIDAVLASMRLPFIFTPFVYNNFHYIDGGAVTTLPLNYFKNKNNKVIFINLKERLPEEKRDFSKFLNYFTKVIKICVNKIEYHEITKIETTKFPILTINLDISHSLNFEMTKEEKLNIINQGYTTSKKFFK